MCQPAAKGRGVVGLGDDLDDRAGRADHGLSGPRRSPSARRGQRAVGIAPLVVVPAEDLDHPPVAMCRGPRTRTTRGCRRCRGTRVAASVYSSTPPVALVVAASSNASFTSSIGRVPVEDRDEVDDGAVRHRHPQRDAVEAAGELRAAPRRPLGSLRSRSARSTRRRPASGAGRPCRCGHVGLVEERLVAGVGVHRRHESLLDAEPLVEHARHRRQAVRRARRVGHDRVRRRVVGGVVHADADRQRRRPGPAPRPTTRRAPASRCAAAAARDRNVPAGLDHHVDVVLRPRDLGGFGVSADRDLRCSPTRSPLRSPRRRWRARRRRSRARAGRPGCRRPRSARSPRRPRCRRSGPRSSRTRSKDRPIRPNPLMPTRTVMFSS